MKYRQLGNSGLIVSEMGFGGWGIGGATKGATSYGPTDDNESIKALKEAHNQGINFFDTADVYGHSEELIGKAFKTNRGRVILATKVGFLDHHAPQDFSKENLIATIEKSLKNMDTDYVDLYQLHNPDFATLPMDEIINILLGLKKQGLTRVLGVSVKSPDDGLKALKFETFDSIQVNLSMIDQRARDNGLLDLAPTLGVGIIGRTPLNFGFLTDNGKTMGLDFGPQDHRSKWPKAQLESWQKAARLLSALNPYTNSSLAQFALRFCLDTDGVSTTIPGMLTVQDIMDNIQASFLPPLSQEIMQTIIKIYKNGGFFISRPS